eukprot:1585595-Amphidinium_carterae.1
MLCCCVADKEHDAPAVDATVAATTDPNVKLSRTCLRKQQLRSCQLLLTAKCARSGEEDDASADPFAGAVCPKLLPYQALDCSKCRISTNTRMDRLAASELQVF